MSRNYVDLQLYPCEHHSLSVQDGVVDISVDVLALWDCIRASGLHHALIEADVTEARKEGFDEGFDEAQVKSGKTIAELERSLESERHLNDRLEAELRALQEEKIK